MRLAIEQTGVELQRQASEGEGKSAEGQEAPALSLLLLLAFRHQEPRGPGQCLILRILCKAEHRGIGRLHLPLARVPTELGPTELAVECW